MLIFSVSVCNVAYILSSPSFLFNAVTYSSCSVCCYVSLFIDSYQDELSADSNKCMVNIWPRKKRSQTRELRERERERERERGAGRQAGRQTDRQIDRLTDRQTDRERERERERRRQREDSETGTDKHTSRNPHNRVSDLRAEEEEKPQRRIVADFVDKFLCFDLLHLDCLIISFVVGNLFIGVLVAVIEVIACMVLVQHGRFDVVFLGVSVCCVLVV